MKRVWVVDDAIPLQELYGSLPLPSRLDSEIIGRLVGQAPRERWDEREVFDLCRTLCGQEFEAAFFRSPEALLRALAEGAVPPHAVVFDWQYPGSDDVRNLEALEDILGGSFTYVQVYTHLGREGVDSKLLALRDRFGGRLLPTRAKSEVTPVRLAEEIRTAWAGTIAGQLADNVRKHVLVAVERTLIDICTVPQGALAAMVHGASEDLLHVVLSKVRDEIGMQGVEALEEILAASPAGQSNAAMRRLMSVWYYLFPADKKVRRGDLIELGPDGCLGLVATPPCDLVRFPKKTGRRLTWLRTACLDEAGLNKLRAAGVKIDQIGNSIIASHGRAGDAVVVLPNVPMQEGRREAVADYLVLCHAWESREFGNAPDGALTYDHLEGLRRRCTLAEPFASAVIAKITAVISSPGTPDLPEGEIARLRAAVAQTAQSSPPLAASEGKPMGNSVAHPKE